MKSAEEELKQLKIVATICYRNVEHDLVQKVNTTKVAYDHLMERAKDGEIKILSISSNKNEEDDDF